MDEHIGPDVYAVVERLIRLRDMLRNEPHTVTEIFRYLPNDYTDDEKGKRQLRRDLRNLEALGYTVKRQNKPLRWSITAGPHLLSNEDVETLLHIREAFTDKHPLAARIQR